MGACTTGYPAETKPTALTGPRFTQIHNVKQQTVTLDRSTAGIAPDRTDAISLIKVPKRSWWR